MTFKEGGAFDFSTTYDRLKEQMTQAMEVARESGRAGSGGIPIADLEQLPAYEENGTGSPIHPSANAQPTASTPGIAQAAAQDAELGDADPSVKTDSNSELEHYPPPHEPPPGYEEAQAETVTRDLEENIRRLSS